MSVPLHHEIKAIARSLPAAYLSKEFLEALTSDRLLDSIARVSGNPINTGTGVLAAKLQSAVFVGGLQPTFTRVPGMPASEVAFSLNSTLKVEVQILIAADLTALVSTVHVELSDISLRVTAQDNLLIADNAVFTPTPSVSREPNAEALLQAQGIDVTEASRVEGHIAYGVVTSALASALSQRRTIPLASLFPALDFGSFLRLEPVDNGAKVAIIPSSGVLSAQAACKCASGPDLGMTPGDVTALPVPANPGVNDQIGSVTIGGPLPQNVDPLRDLGPRQSGTGELGVYLPASTQEEMTVEAMPAILIHASDNGFIGFDARATVGFKNVRMRLDAATAGMIVEMDMDLSIDAICNMDMGKGLRLPIGWALVTPAQGSHASLRLGFYPVVIGSEIRLRAVLHDIDTGQYVAIILGVGTALEILGVTAWIGFLIDVVLATVVSVNLPGALKKAIQKYMGTKEWRLIDASEALVIKNIKRPGVERHDVDGDTLLVSYGLSEGRRTALGGMERSGAPAGPRR